MLDNGECDELSWQRVPNTWLRDANLRRLEA